MIEAVRAALEAIFTVLFGSKAGNFGYPFADYPSLATAVVGLIVLAVVLAAVRFSIHRLRTHEVLVVALWIVIAFAAQLALATLAYAPLDAVVESESANGFYAMAQKYSAGDLLARFHQLVSTFPLHARANLPGKTLLYEALGLVTDSTLVLAYLVILLSNLGGVLAYVIAREWFDDSLTALYALVLYLFLPARMYFVPLMNTLSPVLLFLVFWFVTRSLRSRRASDLVLAGVSLYALAIFDPLPLVALPIVAAVALQKVFEGQLGWASGLSMAAWILASFGAVHLAVRMALGFDLIEALRFAAGDAAAFNARALRPYSVWVVHNLKDFFLNVGVAQSLTLAAFAAFAVHGWIGSWRQFAFRTEALLTLAFFAVLVGLDLSGVNRGETVRLWIFLGAVMQILVARALAIWNDRRLFVPVISLSIVQTAICMKSVAWIIP